MWTFRGQVAQTAKLDRAMQDPVHGALVRRAPAVSAITPAAGYVNPAGALVIGIVGGLACYWGAVKLKTWLSYDDSLDAFGIHGIGGLVGAILTGVLALEAFGGAPGVIEGNWNQLWLQFYGLIVTIVFSAVGTFVILKIIDLTIGLRVDEATELEGLDIKLHGERGYER